ncbi:MAG: NAD-dependent protein deacylase [Erysipelotrichaceae bacterium]
MINKLKEMIDSSQNIVLFTGAGMSTESGIPDFRSVDGLYHQKYAYPPETILSHRFFIHKTKGFYTFYKDKMICLDAHPNDAHLYFAHLEQVGKLKAVVTQNIDNLHYAAGNQVVYELHGNVHRNYCMKCGKFYPIEYIMDCEIPYCMCGGLVKPDVVLYEEGLSEKIMYDTIKAIRSCDMLIIAGTSLAVYPAASFINYYQGNRLVVINKSELNVKADLLINGSVGEVCRQLMKKEAD